MKTFKNYLEVCWVIIVISHCSVGAAAGAGASGGNGIFMPRRDARCSFTANEHVACDSTLLCCEGGRSEGRLDLMHLTRFAATLSNVCQPFISNHVYRAFCSENLRCVPLTHFIDTIL